MSYCSSDVAALLAHFPDVSTFDSMDSFGNLLTLLSKPSIETKYKDDWGCNGGSPLLSQISESAASLTLSLSPIITTNRTAAGGGAYSTPMHISCNNRGGGLRVLMASQETIDESVIDDLGTGLSKMKLGQRPHMLPVDDEVANGDNCNSFSCGERDYGDGGGDYFDNDNDNIAAYATQFDNIDEHDIFSSQFYNHNYGDNIKTTLLPMKTLSPVVMSMHPPLGLISSTSSSSSSSSSSLVGLTGLNVYRNAALNLGSIRIQVAQTTDAITNNNTSNHITCNNSINTSRSQMKLWSWLNDHFNYHDKGIIIGSQENRLGINKALISHYMSTVLPKSQEKKHSLNLNPNYFSQRGRMLIVCHKVNVEHFANIARSFVTAKLLVYTESFEKRKRIDSARLSQYHIVITTFDVLKVKEVRMHESYGAHLDALDEVDAGIGNDGWMSSRHTGGGEYFEVSNLHLLKWDMCIIDHGSQVTTAKSENLAAIRSNTIKGNAVKRLKCTKVISLAVIRSKNSKSDNSNDLQDMSGKRKTRLDNKYHANSYDESNCCDISDITDENTRPFSDDTREQQHRVKLSAKLDSKLSNAIINSMSSIMNIPSSLQVTKMCLDLSVSSL